MVIALNYFGVSTRDIVDIPVIGDSFEYVRGVAEDVWDEYIEEYYNYLWHDIFIDLVWDSLKGMMSGESFDVNKLTPPSTDF